MEMQFDIKKILQLSEIDNELDFERALIADRKLRVLSKEDDKYKVLRQKLRDLIESYEEKNWSLNSDVNEDKLQESLLAEEIAEQERLFVDKRKKLIRTKLKELNLNQQEFGIILGHNSKSYISELINGINPFSLKDLILINKLLNIDFTDLIPTFLPIDEMNKIKASLEKLGNRNLKLRGQDLVLE